MFQSIRRLARSGGTRGRRAEQVLLHPHLPKLQGSVVDDLPVEILQLRRAAIRKSLPNPSAQGAAFAMMKTGGGEDHAEMRSAWRRWKDDDRRAWMRRPLRSWRAMAWRPPTTTTTHTRTRRNFVALAQGRPAGAKHRRAPACAGDPMTAGPPQEGGDPSRTPQSQGLPH